MARILSPPPCKACEKEMPRHTLDLRTLGVVNSPQHTVCRAGPCPLLPSFLAWCHRIPLPHVPVQVQVKLKYPSESPGRFVKTQVAGHLRLEFVMQLVWSGHEQVPRCSWCCSRITWGQGDDCLGVCFTCSSYLCCLHPPPPGTNTAYTIGSQLGLSTSIMCGAFKN